MILMSSYGLQIFLFTSRKRKDVVGDSMTFHALSLENSSRGHTHILMGKHISNAYHLGSPELRSIEFKVEDSCSLCPVEKHQHVTIAAELPAPHLLKTYLVDFPLK